MANTKISQLTALTNPTWNEEFVYALNNANGKVTLDTMKTYTQTWTQEELVSWTNIKTINGQSILWSWNMVISWWGGWDWQVIFDCIVDAAGNWDYTTLWAAITAGNRNIFIREWVYNESPITLVDDSFTIVWANTEWVILNYSIVAGPYQTWWACITFSTSAKTSSTDAINHNISWITFNISETWSTDNTSWYLINWNAKSSNPIYTCNVDDCNINVVQSWANIRYYDYILWWNITFSRCNINVNSESNNTAYYWWNENTMYGISSARYIWCTLRAFTASNNYVILYPTAIPLIWCKLDAKSTWTWNASIFASDAVDSYINVEWTTSWATLQRCSNCTVRIDWWHPLEWLTYSSVVEVWESSKAYSVWDFVLQNTSVYKCTTAHTSWADFDPSNWLYIWWSSMTNVYNSDITVEWLLYVRWEFIWNTVWSNEIVLVWDDRWANPWAMFIWNKSKGWISNSWIKVIWQICVCNENSFKTANWIRYNDWYHIIKDNILQSNSSSNYPTVDVVWTNNNHSKVSDNILRYWQDN